MKIPWGQWRSSSLSSPSLLVFILYLSSSAAASGDITEECPAALPTLLQERRSTMSLHSLLTF